MTSIDNLSLDNLSLNNLNNKINALEAPIDRWELLETVAVSGVPSIRRWKEVVDEGAPTAVLVVAARLLGGETPTMRQLAAACWEHQARRDEDYTSPCPNKAWKHLRPEMVEEALGLIQYLLGAKPEKVWRNLDSPPATPKKRAKKPLSVPEEYRERVIARIGANALCALDRSGQPGRKGLWLHSMGHRAETGERLVPARDWRRIDGEVCVSSASKPVFGRPKIALLLLGKVSVLHDRDAWSEICPVSGLRGRRAGQRWGNSCRDEGWLVPAECRVLAIAAEDLSTAREWWGGALGDVQFVPMGHVPFQKWDTHRHTEDVDLLWDIPITEDYEPPNGW